MKADDLGRVHSFVEMTIHGF
ncbi:MAG: hypothetical protein JWQ04_2508, partial [Pedosphaera sp.]|nr:hypothetical protein [Pedosphaera sp.]